MKAINRPAICQTKVPIVLSTCHLDVDDDVEALLSVRFFCEVF